MSKPENVATGAKILVVEDSAAVRSRIVWELSEVAGVDEVLQAEDVRSALSLLEAHRPEVAVLDLHLRTQLVFPILEDIRARSLSTISIIFTNAEAGPLRDACIRLGARNFLPKSGGVEEVANVVAEVLSQLPSTRPECSAASNSPISRNN